LCFTCAPAISALCIGRFHRCHDTIGYGAVRSPKCIRSLQNDVSISQKVALNRKKDFLSSNRTSNGRGHRIGRVPAKSPTASFKTNDPEWPHFDIGIARAQQSQDFVWGGFFLEFLEDEFLIRA